MSDLASQKNARMLDDNLSDIYDSWPNDWKKKFKDDYNKKFEHKSIRRIYRILSKKIEPLPDEYYWIRDYLNKWENHRNGEDISNQPTTQLGY